jgi:hypothetical protein
MVPDKQSHDCQTGKAEQRFYTHGALRNSDARLALVLAGVTCVLLLPECQQPSAALNRLHASARLAFRQSKPGA